MMDYVIADAVINGLSKAITSSQIKIDKSLSEKMDFFMTRLIVAASKPNLLAVYDSNLIVGLMLAPVKMQILTKNKCKLNQFAQNS